jgi:hypothetical protein
LKKVFFLYGTVKVTIPDFQTSTEGNLVGLIEEPDGSASSPCTERRLDDTHTYQPTKESQMLDASKSQSKTP